MSRFLNLTYDPPGTGPLGPSCQNTYSVLLKTPLVFPSIGLERTAHFAVRPRSFDPGVCSRSGWMNSSRGTAVKARFEHRPNSFKAAPGFPGHIFKESLISQEVGLSRKKRSKGGVTGREGGLGRSQKPSLSEDRTWSKIP